MMKVDTEIVRLYQEGKSCDQVADALALQGSVMSGEHVRARLKLHGIQLRGRKAAADLRVHSQRAPVRHGGRD